MEDSCELTFPNSWRLTNYYLPHKNALSEEEIKLRLLFALENDAIRSKLDSAHSACIIVDDLTRPPSWELVLKCMIDILNGRDIGCDSILILVSIAGHAQMSDAELSWKIGSHIRRQVKVVQHSLNCKFNWFDYKGKKVGINSLFCDADFRVALGTLIPHPFAGFSGGGKAVMPGISDLETIHRNHFQVLFGRGKVWDPDNPVRKQMDDIAEMSGLDLLVNVVCNASREIISVHAGSLRKTFAEGVIFAQRYCAMRLQSKHNVVVLNVYPKDNELLQADNAFNIIDTLPEEYKKMVKVVVMVAHCRKGLGHQAVFGPGGSLYKSPSPLQKLVNRKMILFSPTLDEETFYQVFANEYKLVNKWSDAIELLYSYNMGSYDIGMFHQASMQTINRW